MPISTVWRLNYVQQCYVKWFWTIPSLGAPVKSVFAFFLFFIAIIPTCLLCQMLANPSWAWSHAVNLQQQGNVKKNIHLKRAIHGQIQGLPVFYQSCSHHLVKWYALWNALSRQLYFVNLAVFFTWVLCLTLKFEAHDQNMNLQKFSRLTEKGSNAHILQFCFKHTLAF